MKKVLPLPLLTLALAGAGMGLRRWQLASAFEAETGLPVPGAPATYALVALVAAAAVGFFLLSRWSLGRGAGAYPPGYLASFATPNPVGTALLFLAGVLLFAGGVLGVRDFALGLHRGIVRLVLSLCLLLTGVCVGMTGLLGLQREERRGRFFLPLVMPGYCGCAWLVYAYQSHTANPNAMEYVFLLLGIICAVIGAYAVAAFSFEKPQPTLCAWSCAMGAVLLTVAGADGGGAVETLTLRGYSIYLFVQMTTLLYRGQRPAQLEPWTPAAQEDAITEVSDHE